MKYTKQQIIEYAQLAQQCYYIPENKQQLPNGWKLIFIKQSQWDTLYVLYVNHDKREVVLAIRGTDKEYNYLTNASLLLGNLTGRHEEVPGVNRVEKLASEVSKLSVNTEAARQLAESIDKFDWTVAGPLNKSFLTGACASAKNVGLNTEKSPESTLTNEQLIEHLEESPGCQQSTEELNKALVEFKRQNFSAYTFRIVGHSLGGVIAELCAVKVGAECISFESPGSLELLDKLTPYKNKPRNIVNFLSAPNIINTLNYHAGTIYRMKLPHTEGSFSLLHSANCLMHSGIRLSAYATGIGAIGGVLSTAASTIGEDLAAISANKLVGSIASVGQDIGGLMRQHSIDNIVLYLQTNDMQLVEMDTGPQANGKDLIYWLKERVRDFLPFQKDKPGIRNITDEEGMREAQIKRMPGYQEKNIDVALLLHINKMREELGVGKEKKQGLEQEQKKYKSCQEELAKLTVVQTGSQYQTTTNNNLLPSKTQEIFYDALEYNDETQLQTNGKTHGSPFLAFTEEITQTGIEQGINKENCKEGLNIGLQAEDAKFAAGLHNKKKVNAEGVLNHGIDKILRREYQAYLEQRQQIAQQIQKDYPMTFRKNN